MSTFDTVLFVLLIVIACESIVGFVMGLLADVWENAQQRRKDWSDT